MSTLDPQVVSERNIIVALDESAESHRALMWEGSCAPCVRFFPLPSCIFIFTFLSFQYRPSPPRILFLYVAFSFILDGRWTTCLEKVIEFTSSIVILHCPLL